MLPWTAPERDPHVSVLPELVPALLQQLSKRDPLQDYTVAGAKKPRGEVPSCSDVLGESPQNPMGTVWSYIRGDRQTWLPFTSATYR